MTQNTSHAVMAQRHEAHDSLDMFPTPAWATRAIAERLPLAQATVWEPAAGAGHMAHALEEYASQVIATDIEDYGFGFRKHDFLMPFLPMQTPVQFVITNPPFRLAEEFIKRGLEVAEIGVAVLVRSVFAEGVGRHRDLFSTRAPAAIHQFVERVPMVKGRVDRNASTATSYAWFVWLTKGSEKTQFEWIPPCRRRLERDKDYF